MKQLSTFQISCETLNFTKSAELLNYAQSSVTSQIKSLEEELGVKLFERLGNKLVLTSYGEKFKDYCSQIISQYHSALDEFSYDKNMTATLTVGATESQCAYKLPFVLNEIKLLFPKVRIIVKPVHKIDQVQADIRSGDLDFVFLLGTNFNEEYRFHVSRLSREKLILVASPENDVNKMTNPSIEDLKEETLLLTESGCVYRELFEDMLNERKIDFISKFEITNIETLKNCVKSNLGIALLPYAVVKNEIEDGTLKIINWKTNMDTEIFHFMSWHQDKNLTPLMQTFISISEDVF